MKRIGRLQEWSTVQRLCGCMGQEGLNRRILDLEVEELNPEIVARAKQITDPIRSHSVVQTVSAGAAAFHVWVSTKHALPSLAYFSDLYQLVDGYN
jgi:hypothetical protein